jgi:hypothetical protein
MEPLPPTEQPASGLEKGTRGVALLATVLLALGAGAAAQILGGKSTPWPVPFLLYSLSAIGLASVIRRAEPEEAVEHVETRRSGLWVRRVGISLAVAGGLLLLNASRLLCLDWSGSFDAAVPMGAVGVVVLGLGADLMAGHGPRLTPGPSRIGRALFRPETLVLLFVLAVGFWFRFRSFGSFPPPDGFSSCEESQEATTAMRISTQPGCRPWEWPLSQYVPALSFNHFGRRIETLRGPATALGFATLVPFYLLARSMVGPAAALFGAALLAVSRGHVQMSWYSDEAYVPLTFFVTLLAVLFGATRSRRPLLFAIAGAMTAASLYFYAAYRVIPVLVAAFLLSELASARRRPFGWRELTLMAATFIAVAAPLGVILRREGTAYYLEALHRSTANTDYYTSDWTRFLSLRAERVHATFDALTQSDHGVFFPSLNAAAEPFLDPFTSVSVVLGFGTSLALLRRRHRAWVVLTFLVVIMGATVVVQNLDFRRLGMVVPYLFLFPAFLAGDLLAASRTPAARRVVLSGLGAIAILAAAYNYRFLFRVLGESAEVRSAHKNDYTVPAFYLSKSYRGEYVVILTPEDGYVIRNFFEPNDYDWLKPEGLKGEVRTGLGDTLPLPASVPADQPVLLLIQPPFDLQEVTARVRHLYPGVSCEVRKDPDHPAFDLGVCRILPTLRRP